MKLTLPKLYPITDTRISGLTHLEQVRRMIAGGASLIQLRDKTASSGAFFRAASETVDFAHAHDTKIIINDRVDLALAVGADGVHLGQDDLSPVQARKLLGDQKIIGFSTHSVEQVLASLKFPVDYIAIGPVFATSTKADPDPVLGLSGVKAARRAVGDLPLVAIGGICRSNAISVVESGADCVAMISDLVSDPEEIFDRVRKFLDALR